MSSTTPRASAAVHVNGPALRAFRQLQGVEIADLVVALECDASYLSRLETGARRRCSPSFLTRLVAELGITDRRAVMACPYAAEEHGTAHLDDGGNTAPMPRPGPDPADATPVVAPRRRGGAHRRARTGATA